MSLIVVHQFERVGESRGGCLGGKALTEIVEAGVYRRGVGDAGLMAILRGDLRAKRLFLFDAIEVEAAAWGGGLGGKRCASQQESEPHTLWWHTAEDCGWQAKAPAHQARRILMLLLPHFHFLQPVGALQDFARLAAVRRTDDAVALHAIQNARGAPVAQAQMAL